MRSLAAAAALSVVAGAPATHHIAIRDNGFEPAHVTVAVGDTITWTNRGQLVHTVKVEGEESSGRLEPGDTESTTFATPGTRPYQCEIHPFMTGTIVVQGSSTSTSSSTTTTLRRSTSTTSTTTPPFGSSVSAPPESTTTSSSLEETTTTSSTVATGESDESATRVTDGNGDDGDNVDVPTAIAAVLLLLTAAAALVQIRGGFR